MGNNTDNSENVAIAFALVIGAGASTALGASVVFFPSLVKLASRKTLAGALGLSAGVMTYVSFVEIFQKSVLAFEDAGFSDDDDDNSKAYVYATVCFFGGVLFMVLLNYIVHKLLGNHKHHNHHQLDSNKSTQDLASTEGQDEPQSNDPAASTAAPPNSNSVPTPPCCTEDCARQLDDIHQMAEVEAGGGETKPEAEEDAVDEQEEKQEISEHPGDGNTIMSTPVTDELNAKKAYQEHQAKLSKEEAARLTRMSLKTAVAIGLHNFPEGLATFVAALHDPGVGAVLAIAIAIHNVPEGLCVAMPVYYATGNRSRAFLWAVLSGVSEPFAALLGWAVLANSFSDTLYGVLFGGVAGMMVIISVRELLPMAHRYDPDDSVVTNMFIVGMSIMALSLVLFLL